ncbi:MAG: cytochrome C oxidase Cbb3 [Gammaproteobacteria bacterium]|nr:MAG: cytochrome C oxidase Cbb3 [Gammaproteobacteria bacterium]
MRITPRLRRYGALLTSMLGLVLAAPQAIADAPNSPEALYTQHCAACHGVNRLGGMGPALLPENLGRLRPAKAVKVIRDGRPATQMPAFGHQLSDKQIKALAKWIYTPLPHMPDWGQSQIQASRIQYEDITRLPKSPVYQADMQNLFVVVETGDHHVTVLDGDTFEPITRFPSRYALHGGPKYSPDGRFVYFGSRDGWITQYDLYSLKVVAEIRAGINMRNVAISDDGHWLMAANYLPHTLVLLDAITLEPVKIYPVADLNGKSSRVSAVYTAPPRHSFIAALKDVKEVWEIPYPNLTVPKVYDRPLRPAVQALRAHAVPMEVQRIPVADYLDDFFFDPDYRYLIGASRSGGSAWVMDLDTRQPVTELALGGMPHLGSGITWRWKNTRVLATPNLKKGEITIIDMATWKPIKRLPTPGPGFFMRSHSQSPWAWADVFFGPNRDQMLVINKQTLEIEKTLIPRPGKTSAHIEYTRDGKYALLSIWENPGELIVYDAQTLKELKSLPMSKPSGKYNVFNKTHYDEGTSH